MLLMVALPAVVGVAPAVHQAGGQRVDGCVEWPGDVLKSPITFHRV